MWLQAQAVAWQEKAKAAQAQPEGEAKEPPGESDALAVLIVQGVEVVVVDDHW